MKHSQARAGLLSWLALAASCLTGTVNAEDFDQQTSSGVDTLQTESNQGLMLGERTRLAPTVRVRADWTDNLYYSNDANGPVSAFSQHVMPRVGFYSAFNIFEYSLEYLGDYAWVQTEQRDDYHDHDVRARIVANISSRHQVTVNADYLDGHDAFGLDRTENATNLTQGLDTFGLARAFIGYRFGREDTRAQLGVQVGGNDLNYSSNRDSTARLDRNAMQYSGYFNYRVSDRTALNLIVSHENNNFEQSALADSRGSGVLLGASWELSGRTSGHARVGWRRRTFDSATAAANGFNDFNGVNWDIRVQWQPTAKATLIASSGVRERETYLANTSFIDERDINLSWQHRWTDAFRTDLNAGFLQRDFVDSPDNRQADIFILGAGFKRALSKKFNVLGQLNFRDRNTDSTLGSDVYDYQRSLISLGVDATL